MKRARTDGREPHEDCVRCKKKTRNQRHISDLDDGCLLQVLKRLTPLPDLFSVAATCKRFKQLTTDARLSVLVTQHETQEQKLNIGRRVLPTLQAAVLSSRAGDTIVLEAGQMHDAHDVVILWPLKLVGSGNVAEDTLLVCPKGPEAALDFRSTGKVANLTIKATLSNCILHRRGRVTVEGCKLQCHAAGLEHLFTPLVTLAAAGLTKQLQHWPVVTGKEAGMGVLSVVETKIRGGFGATAVNCGGTGALQSVRVIHLSRDTLFWFDVHAAKPGLVCNGASADRILTQCIAQPTPITLDKATVSHSGQVGTATTVQAEPAIASGATPSSADEDGAMRQRVKAWNATWHPALLTA